MTEKKLVREELEAATGSSRRVREANEAYRERLMVAVNELSDEAFGELSEEAQNWMDAAVKAFDEDRASPPFPDEPHVGVDVTSLERPLPKPAKGEPALTSETQSASTAPAKSAEAKKAPKAAPKATPKKSAAPKAPKPKGPPRNRKGAFEDTQKIKVLAKENPRREGTGRFKRFAKYKNGMTVAEARKLGIKGRHLAFDMEEKLITVE